MNILVSIDGKEEGSFPLDVLNQRLAKNEINASKMHAWYDGLPEWISLAQVPGILIPETASPPPLPVQSMKGPPPPLNLRQTNQMVKLPAVKAPQSARSAIVKAKSATNQLTAAADNRERIEYYFTGKLSGPVWGIILGMLLIPVSSASDDAKAIILLAAVGLVIGGVYGIVRHYKKMPSGKQMDEWFNEESKAFQEKAMAKCGVDESECVAEQVIVWGPRVFNHGNAPFLVKKGKDGVIRYNPFDLTIINFGENQLLGYQCCYDRTSGAFLLETTEEYFYQDVVSVATASDSTVKEIEVGRAKTKVQSKSREMFKLTTSGGTSITVVLRDDGLVQMDDLKGGSMPTSQAENAIQSVRRMLRDKKRI